jgi:tetratricopeptide (TPR) repeat protein
LCRHFKAFLGTLEACHGTFLAVVLWVLAALVAAALADFCAVFADQVHVFAIAPHEIGRQPAEGRAIPVECDTACHFRSILALAGFRAALAGLGTCNAGVDAGLVMIMGYHANLLISDWVMFRLKQTRSRICTVTHTKHMRTLSLILFLAVMPCMAEEPASNVVQIRVAQFMQDWAEIQYQQPREAKAPAFKALSVQAHELALAHPDAAEPLVWQAVALASYAQAVRGREGLRAATKARDLLFAAERINPRTLDGAIYLTLGRLYFKVPGWPIGFGSKTKARMYLMKALEMNPQSIEANLFYADLLSGQGDYTEAAEFYRKALSAPPRAGQEIADAGRRRDAETRLRNVESKLGTAGIYNAGKH